MNVRDCFVWHRLCVPIKACIYYFFISISFACIPTGVLRAGWRWGTNFVPSDPVKDLIGLHQKLFTSWDTYKIAVGFFPPFVLARMFDEKLQNHFYCRKHHKNRHQFPKTCHDICHWGVSVPIIVLGSTAFLSRDWDFRITGWVFLVGMPFVILGKDMFKQVESDCCYRPWHENFCRKKRSLGGFPSGHMAELTYMTVLYGKRYGRLIAAPLAAAAGFLAVTFINCNRHYISQIVGGAALGTAYALAADKLIDTKLSKQVDLGFTVDAQGAPALKLSYQF